jgi:hypothetical protein
MLGAAIAQSSHIVSLAASQLGLNGKPTPPSQTLDQGQNGIVYGVPLLNGSGNYLYEWEVNRIDGVGTIYPANTLTFIFSTNTTMETGEYTLTELAYDLGTDTLIKANVVAKLNFPLGNLTMPNIANGTTFDKGQKVVFSTRVIDGLGSKPYHYDFTILNSLGDKVYTSGFVNFNSFSYVSNSIGILHAVIVVKDNATTPEVRTVNSSNIIVNLALGKASIPLLNTTNVISGNKILMTTYETGGTVPYSYNFIVSNSASNKIIGYSGPIGSNSFEYTTNVVGAFHSYVVISDSAATHSSSKSAYSKKFTVEST